jgi:DNA-binding transcriptional LysR family regulator
MIGSVNLDLRRLRYFQAVVETGTVTAAAERLHIAQPAVSRQLHTLEKELGLSLFERSGTRLRLSTAGQHFVGIANDLLAQVEQVEQVAHDMAHGSLARIRVAAAQTTISEVLAPFVATLTPADPFVRVQEVEGDQVHAVVAESADLGVAAGPPPAYSLAWQHLTDVPLRAYVAPSHEWAQRGRRSVRLDELVSERLVLLTREHPTRLVFDDAVIRAGLTYADLEESPSSRMSQSLAAAQFGIAVVTDLPRFGVHPLLIRGADGETLRLPLHACWPANHYAAAALEPFVARLRDFNASLIHQTAWDPGLTN